MTKNTLTVTDNRTGKTYEIPIEHGAIRATDLRQIKTDPDDFGLMSYDPAFMNTASCISRITYIDGDKGILEYRGYPIEQLAEQSSYLEVAYLLLYGELPSKRAPGVVGVSYQPPPVPPQQPGRTDPGISLRRAPDGHSDQLGRCNVHPLSRSEKISRTRSFVRSRSGALSGRSRPSPLLPTATASGGPSTCPTARSATPPTCFT